MDEGWMNSLYKYVYSDNTNAILHINGALLFSRELNFFWISLLFSNAEWIWQIPDFTLIPFLPEKFGSSAIVIPETSSVCLKGHSSTTSYYILKSINCPVSVTYGESNK